MAQDSGITDPLTIEKSLRGKHSFAVVRAAIKMDIENYLTASAAFMEQRKSLVRTIGTLLTPSLICVTLFRISHWLWCARWRRLSHCLTGLNQVLLKASFTPWSNIGPGLYVAHPYGTIFDADAGRNLVLFPYCAITRYSIDHGDVPPSQVARPQIGNNVSAATFATVCGGVTIGDDVRLGPYVCVRSDVAPGAKLICRAKTRIRPHAASGG